jgi:hypothetical protein
MGVEGHLHAIGRTKAKMFVLRLNSQPFRRIQGGDQWYL